MRMRKEKLKNNSIKAQVYNAIEALNSGLVGRDEAIKVLLLAVLSCDNIFLLGPPGTAKSLISRRVASIFCTSCENSGYFEYLMNEFSTPDEICGPVSLSMLKKDMYCRLTDGYLPSAKIAFLDEIFKSGPAILNTLLSLINEKIYHNGSNVMKSPLISLIGAGNETPSSNQGLEALFDRFTLRVLVENVDDEDFISLLENDNISLEEFSPIYIINIENVLSNNNKIESIELGDEIKKTINALRLKIREYNDNTESKENVIYVSDRKWKKCIHLLKTSAFYNERKSVNEYDCLLLQYCFWNNKDEYYLIKDMLFEVLNFENKKKNIVKDELTKAYDDFKEFINNEFLVTKFVPKIEEINSKKYYKCKKNGKICYFPFIEEDEEGQYFSISSEYIALDAKKREEGRYYEPKVSDDNLVAYKNERNFFSINSNEENEARSVFEFFIDKKEELKSIVSSDIKKRSEKINKEYNRIISDANEKLNELNKEREQIEDMYFNNNIFLSRNSISNAISDIEKAIREVDDFVCQIENLKSRYDL